MNFVWFVVAAVARDRTHRNRGDACYHDHWYSNGDREPKLIPVTCFPFGKQIVAQMAARRPRVISSRKHANVVFPTCERPSTCERRPGERANVVPANMRTSYRKTRERHPAKRANVLPVKVRTSFHQTRSNPGRLIQVV